MNDGYVPAHPSHQSKLLVEDHLLQQRGLVVEEVRLHVAPHVREPPELIHVLEQQIVSLVFLWRAWTRGNTSVDKDGRMEREEHTKQMFSNQRST